MSQYVYQVRYRREGAETWIQHGELEESSPGGMRTVGGLTNGLTYEFMVVRTGPSFRESTIARGVPVLNIDVSPDTFVPAGEQAVSEDESTTGQRGIYNDKDGVLLNFTGGANWDHFDVVVDAALLCRVEKAPLRVVIDGTKWTFAAQPTPPLVIQVDENSLKQFFINTGGGANVTVKPNGASSFTLVIT